MYPGRKTPSVVIDTFGEVDTLAVATNYVNQRIPFELSEILQAQLPNFNGIMAAHEIVLPLAKKAGTLEPMQAPITIDESQVALLSTYLFATAKGHRDKLVRASSREAIAELAADLRLSHQLINEAEHPPEI